MSLSAFAQPKGWGARDRRPGSTAPPVTNMRTIAITIDEDTLAAIDRLSDAGRSRSELVREALREYLLRREQRLREDDVDRRIIAEHREDLARSAEALVRDQAKL